MIFTCLNSHKIWGTHSSMFLSSLAVLAPPFPSWFERQHIGVMPPLQLGKSCFPWRVERWRRQGNWRRCKNFKIFISDNEMYCCLIVARQLSFQDPLVIHSQILCPIADRWRWMAFMAVTAVIDGSSCRSILLPGPHPLESHVGKAFFFIAPGRCIKGSMNFDLGLDHPGNAGTRTIVAALRELGCDSPSTLVNALNVSHSKDRGFVGSC